ncbi:methyltransferase domain-containing protein [Neptunicella sp. SCSIO 80796]|uniref:methyltransferase domain-containing protein n=1 Tax=Neptunicella plasticusilytica TaxID=3117012 RepID=UPI003A4D535D
MVNREKILVVASAKLELVKDCLAQLFAENLVPSDVTLLSTKAYRIDAISDYLDMQCKMLTELEKVDLQPFKKIIVIQHSRNIIPYLNVYKFLKANQVDRFSIKTSGLALVDTQPDLLLANVNQSGTEQDNLFWINPADVTHCAHLGTLHFGSVADGDWDLKAQPFATRILFYPSLQSRIDNNLPWCETPYYLDLLDSVNKGEIRFNCKSEQDILARCEKLEALYKEIRDRGWQQPDGQDYITINIGRDGQLLFADGRHRMSIAKLLGLSKIPVKIAVRHQQWVDFKNEVSTYAKEQGGEVYAPLHHIDLSEFKCTHDGERFELVADNISKPASKVLDIGSHWGRACAVLEQRGHECVAVEGNITSFYFLERIKKIEGHRFTPVCENIFDFVSEPKSYDVVLALNIFHHFIKTEELYEKLVTLLSRLDVAQLFLQTHNPQEPQMLGAFKNFEGEEFCQFVVEHSCLNKARWLAEIGSGRHLYVLEK